MTRERAKELLQVIQAYADGKPIEFKMGDSDWKLCTETDFHFDIPYRIKPEPRLRPWRPEEVPVGAVVVPTKNPSSRRLIVAVDNDLVRLAGFGCLTSEALFACYKTSDGKPCGVEET